MIDSDASKIQEEINKLPHFPTTETKAIDPELLSKRRDDWAFDAGRQLKFANVDPSLAYEVFTWVCHSYQIGDDLRQRMLNSFDNGLRKGVIPPNVLQSVYDAIIWYKANIGNIPAPVWCRAGGPKSEEFWMACKILGAKGRPFQFARCKIGEIFGMESGSSVQYFVRVMLKHDFLQKVLQGCAYGNKQCTQGKSDEFQLADSRDWWDLVDMIPHGIYRKEQKRKWVKYLLSELKYFQLESVVFPSKRPKVFG